MWNTAARSTAFESARVSVQFLNGMSATKEPRANMWITDQNSCQTPAMPTMHGHFVIEVAATDLASICKFAVSIIGIITLFTAANCLHRWSLNAEPKQKSILHRTFLTLTRVIKKFTVKKCFLFPSNGHLVLFAVYLAINVTLLLANTDLTSLRGIAKRLGWMATGNMCLTFVLAMKNTPLSVLTSFSYEKLNIIHQATGYMTATLALLHGITFTVSFAKVDMLFVIGSHYQRFGIAAGLMMLIIALTSRLFIRRCYEIFYIMHVIFVVAILVMLYFHRPWINTRTSVIIFICAGLFVLDKVIRIIKYACFSCGTTATIVPLANGSTRITLNRGVPGARAGSHAFLWLPRIRALQSHPCTMVSANPVAFILKARDGFTKDLHRHASSLTNIITPATIDSAYGVVPSFEKYGRVLLIAGGSGATWTIAVAMDLLSRDLPNMLELVWVIRDSETLSWFEPELRTLHQSANVNLRLHCTGHIPDAYDTSYPSSEIERDIEKLPSSPISSDVTPNGKDVEKASVHPHVQAHPVQLSHPPSLPPLIPGRPNIPHILSDVIRGMDKYDRICVGACGPGSMLDMTRNAAAAANANTGPAVDLHVETYGW